MFSKPLCFVYLKGFVFKAMAFSSFMGKFEMGGLLSHLAVAFAAILVGVGSLEEVQHWLVLLLSYFKTH